MCISPSTLADGTVVACRKCPQCRDLKIADWVGRNIAESLTSVGSNSVTLTYGRVGNEVLHSHAVALFYSDVQKYLKLYRRHGFPVRYFVTGEFGGLKGRTHWHIVLHWKEAVPPHVLHENWDDEHWEHGFSFWRPAHAGTVQYNCKYIMKDLDDAEAQGLLRMSKKPPIGAAWFEARARSAARQGVPLRSLEYSFPHIRYVKGEKAGRRKEFRLTGRSAELYVEAYIDEWRRCQTAPIYETELLREYNQGWLRELRRIKERREDTGLLDSPLRRFQLSRDNARMYEILRAQRGPLNMPIPEPKRVRFGPRDLEEWEWQFEKEWKRGEARRREEGRNVPEYDWKRAEGKLIQYREERRKQRGG